MEALLKQTGQFEGHTSGPWAAIAQQTPYKGRFQVRGPDDAGPKAYAVASDMREANARLIAAAPDLLKQRDELRYVLRELLGYCREGSIKTPQGFARELARSLLAKCDDSTV